ncbi:MAG: oligosaccharide flippase family protein [Sphingosinicella sp.]|uniref:oligosaccharide flippase family protein n=1 Tax=Sphingosinicella sp. TaxID=1917971 RepID=UPI00403823A9
MASGISKVEHERTGSGGVYRSAATAVALTWVLRLIGFCAVFLLARLLSPRDFGIMALAAAAMALVDIFSALGIRQALLRIPEPERAHLDTAWTIQLILLVVLAAVLAATAPAVAAFFDEPALAPVTAVLSLRFVLQGLANIGIVEFDRTLQLGKDLRMRVSVRLAALVGTVIAAVLLRSYWALAIGLVLQSALHLGASYLFHPYRPRFSLAKRAELLNVSLWMFLAYAAQVVHHQAERLAVGKIAATHVVGFYSIGKDLASIFTMEIATALNRVTFVTTARTGAPLHRDAGRAVAMLGSYAMIAAPAGIGIAAVAEDTVAVLFGAQWLAAAPLLQLIAPALALYAVYKLIVSSLQASGRARTAAIMSCAGAAATATSVFAVAAAGGGVLGIAAAALVLNAITLLAGMLVFARVSRVSTMRLAATVGRPFAAAAAMFLLVKLAAVETGYALADLGLSISLGAAAYAAALLSIWVASGRPEGAESTALALLRDRLGAQLRQVT